MIKRLIEQSLTYGILKNVSLMVGVLGSIMLARLAGPATVAQYVTILASVEIIFAFSQIGVSILYQTNYRDEEYKGALCTITYFLNVVTFTTFVVFISFTESQILPAALVLGFSKALEGLSSINRAEFEYNEKFIYLGTMELLVKVIAYAIAALIMTREMGVIAFITKDTLIYILPSVVLFTKIGFPKFKLSLIYGKIVDYKKIFQLASLRIVENSSKNLPYLVLGLRQETSYIERSLYLLNIVNQALIPVLTKTLFIFNIKQNAESVRLAMVLTTVILCAVCLPMSVFVSYQAEWLVYVVLGADWWEMSSYLSTGAWLIFILPIRSLFEFYLLGKEDFHLNLLFKLLSLIVLLIFIGLYQIKLIDVETFYFGIILSIATNSLFLFAASIRKKYYDQNL